MEKPQKIILHFGDKAVELPAFEGPTEPKWKTGNACIDHILNGEHLNPLLQSPELPKIRDSWRRELMAAIMIPPDRQELTDAFHTQWHVSHHFIRKLLDDDGLLLDVAKAWLPPYKGPALALFRGESVDRFERGSIGSAWSDQEKTATMFARGLNAVGKGGVLLRAHPPAHAIVAGPSEHSANWLRENEFTVDPRLLDRIEQVRVFPPAFGA